MVNLRIYVSLKLEQACTNLREYLDMMLLQIEQVCTNLREYLNMMLLQIEHACTNLQEYLYSLNIRKIYIRAVTEMRLSHFCYSPFAVFYNHICYLK